MLLLEFDRRYTDEKYELNQMRRELDRDFVNFIYLFYQSLDRKILDPKDIREPTLFHKPTLIEMEKELSDPINKADHFATFRKYTGIFVEEDKEFGRVFKIKTDDLDVTRGSFAKLRLIYAYLFLSKILPRKEKSLDVGVYDGFGVILLRRIAKNILSIDDDEEMLKRAASHPILDLSMRSKTKSVELRKMRAQDIPFTDEFDYVSMIEILTGGFHGTQEDIQRIVGNAHRALKPGGEFIFTLPSMLAGMIDIVRNANLPARETPGKFKPYREHLSEILEATFGPGNGKYYGQIQSIIDPEGGIHDVIYTGREDFGRGRAYAAITSDYLIPRLIERDDLFRYVYSHYIGRWRKAPEASTKPRLLLS